MKTTLQIAGMRCAGCSSACEKALKKVNGVISASVNLAAAKADIEFDDKIATVDDFCDAIEDAGFAVVDDIEEEKKKN
ncbi:MAG: cation transporter [Spirochaetia bacterium]|nr:cation transporter [Spirochaetia bacterium]